MSGPRAVFLRPAAAQRRCGRPYSLLGRCRYSGYCRFSSDSQSRAAFACNYRNEHSELFILRRPSCSLPPFVRLASSPSLSGPQEDALHASGRSMCGAFSRDMFGTSGRDRPGSRAAAAAGKSATDVHSRSPAAASPAAADAARHEPGRLVMQLQIGPAIPYEGLGFGHLPHGGQLRRAVGPGLGKLLTEIWQLSGED